MTPISCTGAIEYTISLASRKHYRIQRNLALIRARIGAIMRRLTLANSSAIILAAVAASALSAQSSRTVEIVTKKQRDKRTGEFVDKLVRRR